MTAPLPPTSIARRGGMRVSGSLFRSDVGRARRANDDGVLCLNRVPLFALADGKGGPEAARVALETLRDRCADLEGRLLKAAQDEGASQRIAVERTLKGLFDTANEAVARTGGTIADRQIACTLVACTIAGYHAHIAHVGDARAYLLRRGKLRCLTDDHTVAAMQLRHGTITRTEYEMSPFRKTLAQALGVTPSLEVDLAEVRLAPGDRLFLCTNGVNRALSDEILAALLGEVSAEDAADAIVARLHEAGAPDNASLILIDVDGPADDGLRPDELEAAARRSYLLSALADADWLALSAHMEVKRFRIGDAVVRAGERPPGLVVIAAGRAAQCLPGSETPQRELTPGDSVYEVEISLAEGALRLAERDLRALEPTTCFILSRQNFRDFLRRNPTLGSQLTLRQLERLGIGLADATSTIGQIADTIQGRSQKG